MSTIRFLRTFLAVAHHGSFSEAAEQVALTQAAVSFQMRSLEAELGRELFDRSGRLAILNAAGRELLPEIKHLLDLYDRMRLPRTVPGELAGSVSVGSIVSCMGTLSKVVSGMKKSHPKLDVRILSGKASELAGKVEDGELDAAFLVEAGRKMASTRWTPLHLQRHAGQVLHDAVAQHPVLGHGKPVAFGQRQHEVVGVIGMHDAIVASGRFLGHRP